MDQVASYLGYIFPLLLLAAGVAKCLSVARRPTASSRCLYALALVLSGFVVFGLLTLVRNEAVWMFAVLLASLTAMACVAGTIVLGILGLVQLEADTERRFKQGKRQAIAGLALSPVLLAVVVATYWIGFTQQLNERAQARPVAGNSLPAADPAANRSEEFNYSFDPPPLPWRQLEPQRISEDAALGYERPSPDVYFMLIAEALGVEAGIDNSILAESVQRNLREASPDAKIGEVRPLTIHGLEGLQFDAFTWARSTRLAYSYWICSHHGYQYQLIVWSEARSRAAMQTNAGLMFERFHLLDPDKIAHGEDSGPAGDYQSKSFGFDVALEGQPWLKWNSLADTLPDAEYGALAESGGAMAVISVYLGDHDPHQEALLEALLSRIDFDYPQQPLLNRRAARHGDHDALDFELDMDKLRYHARLVRGEGFAYLLAAWSEALPAPEQPAKEPAAVSPAAPPAPSAVFDHVAIRPAAPPSLEEFAAAERKRHAMVFNDLGLYYYRARQYRTSEEHFRQSLAYVPIDATVIENLAQACIANDRYQQALDELDRGLPQLPDAVDLKAMHAWLLSKVERRDESLREYAALFATPYFDEDYFTSYVELLEDADRHEQALALVETRLKDRDSPSLVILKARLLRNLNRLDEALALLSARQAAGAFNPELIYELIDAYRDAERPLDALKLADKLLAEGLDSADTHYLKGTIEYDLKWYKQAQTSFETAHKKEPADQDIKSYLDHVASMLGQGENVILKQPIPLVELPATVTASPPDDLPAERRRDEAAWYPRRAVAIHHRSDVEHRSTTYRTIRIESEAGVSLFSTLQLSFNPLAEQVYVNRLEVFDAGGQLVSKGDAADYYVIDRADGDIVSHDKLLNMPVAGLRPGCRIELAVTLRETSPPKLFPFTRHLFSTSLPVAQSVLSIEGDVDTLAWRSPSELEPERSSEQLVWRLADPTVYRAEPLADDVDAWLPLVYVGDKQATWENEADEYRRTVAERLPVADEISRLSRELVGAADTDDAKVLAVCRSIQRDYTYKALEFGRRGQVMNEAAQTVRNKYGDCKDLSLLMVQLLESAGVPARLAMVNSSQPLVEELPSIDQFDHMIVYLPEFHGGHFIDATDRDDNPLTSTPLGLEGRQALILDAERSRLGRIPDRNGEGNWLSVERSVDISPVGDLQISEKLELRGAYGSAVRGSYRLLDATERKASVHDQLSSQGKSVQLDRVEFKNLDETNKPLTIELGYRVGNVFQRLDEQWVGTLPMFWERELLDAEFVEHRVSPFRFRYPLRLHVTQTVRRPQGFSLAAAPLRRKSATGIVEWHVDAEDRPGALRLHYELTRAVGRHASDRYQEYYESVEQARRALEPHVVLKRAK